MLGKNIICKNIIFQIVISKFIDLIKLDKLNINGDNQIVYTLSLLIQNPLGIMYMNINI